ncbi:SPFH domain-containing protein, partial [Streptomyces sp. NPDC004542]
MSTTTEHTSDSEGSAGEPPRPARLIHNEATTEIPVHLPAVPAYPALAPDGPAHVLGDKGNSSRAIPHLA